MGRKPGSPPDNLRKEAAAMAKKHSTAVFRFPLIMTITAILMGTGILAVAAILPQLQRERENNFVPAQEQIAIKENDSSPAATAEKEIPLTESEDKSVYTLEKKVEITNQKNDAYLKAALIPQWYDADGRLCGGLGSISDFGYAKAPDLITNTQQYVSAQKDSFVILTYHLSPDWSKYWRYDEATGYYHYLTPLTRGATTEPLILGAEIPAEVYALSEGLTLQIDVITDSIQTNADADLLRAFGRK